MKCSADGIGKFFNSIDPFPAATVRRGQSR
jgi:hypothetical protein